MANRRLIVAAIFMVTLAATFILTYLLLSSLKFALAGAVGLVGLTIFFVEPFVGLVNYLLFIYLRPQDYVHALLGMPIMLMIGAATFGLMILHMAVWKRSIAMARAPQNRFVAWLFLAIVISQLATLLPSGVVDAITNFMPTVILYILVANLVTTPRRLKFIMNLMVILAVVLAAQGIMQYYTGQAFGGEQTYEGRIQAIGIFSDPNDLAMALVMVQPLMLMKLLEQSKPYEKLLAIIALAVLCYAVFLTQSRGGLLSFGLLMIVMLSRRYGRVAGLAIGGFMLLTIVVLTPRMSTISAEEGSTYGRIEAWTAGFDMFQTHPLFGVGYRNFTEYHFRTAHNSLVLCVAELGLFGLYPWIMLLYITFKNMDFITREMRIAGKRDTAMYVDTIRYGLVAYCVSAYFLSRTYNELLFIFLGLSVAVTEMFISGSRENFVLIERRDYARGVGVMIAAVVVTKLFLYTAW